MTADRGTHHQEVSVCKSAIPECDELRQQQHAANLSSGTFGRCDVDAAFGKSTCDRAEHHGVLGKVRRLCGE